MCAILKPIHANWVNDLYDYLRNNPDSIKFGFEQAGVNEALLIDLEPKNPFYDLEWTMWIYFACYAFYKHS